MPFPEVERVKYELSPLDHVICQLRFPPILQIESVPPYEFQNRIREQFPNYSENVEIQQSSNAPINIGLGNQIMNQTTTTKNHEFSSEDFVWKINLTRTFMSISSNKYYTWEDFLRRLKEPLEALIDIYKPAFFTRIGLRYVDIFCRSVIGKTNSPWADLINPYFLGLLGSNEVGKSINEMNNVYEIKGADDNSIIRISTSLIKKIDNNEECFMIDSDVFTTCNINISDSLSRLNFLHDRSSRLLRYAITDEMHNGMRPSKL